MKYRRLHRQELDAVEKEFVLFLAANSVTADDWENLKANEAEKAEKLIELFSDFFWENTLGNINYLVEKGEHVYRAYHADDKEVHLIEIRLPENAPVTFTQQEDLQKLRDGVFDLQKLGAKFYTGKNKSGDHRNKVLFELVERGATPDTGEQFQALAAMVRYNN